jgi:Cytidine and deoxycytidylate deaminase zinc-binding region
VTLWQVNLPCESLQKNFLTCDNYDSVIYGRALRDSRLMDLLEFSRVIHAEMSAICDAARLGRTTKDATLFCTTFPCTFALNTSSRRELIASCSLSHTPRAYLKSCIAIPSRSKRTLRRSSCSNRLLAFRPEGTGIFLKRSHERTRPVKPENGTRIGQCLCLKIVARRIFPMKNPLSTSRFGA